MTALTSKQINDLNRMNRAAQNGTLGTRINALEVGVVPTPAVGTVAGAPVVKYSTAPALQTATYVHAAIAMTAGTQTITSAITSPDVPRVVTIKGNAGGITGNVVITGTNILDAVITDTIALNGSTEVVGTKAFKSVVSIGLPAETHAGTDTVSVGIGVKLGLPTLLLSTAFVLVKCFAGAVDAGTVSVSTTIETTLYAVAGTMDAVKKVDLYYIVP